MQRQRGDVLNADLPAFKTTRSTKVFREPETCGRATQPETGQSSWFFSGNSLVWVYPSACFSWRHEGIGHVYYKTRDPFLLRWLMGWAPDDPRFEGFEHCERERESGCLSTDIVSRCACMCHVQFSRFVLPLLSRSISNYLRGFRSEADLFRLC